MISQHSAVRVDKFFRGNLETNLKEFCRSGEVELVEGGVELSWYLLEIINAIIFPDFSYTHRICMLD